MAEYIEREAAKEFIRSYRHSTDIAFHMEKHLNEIPAADVRPVVLCRDCEYYQADCGWCGWFDIGMNVKSFCSLGKKREES